VRARVDEGLPVQMRRPIARRVRHVPHLSPRVPHGPTPLCAAAARPGPGPVRDSDPMAGDSDPMAGDSDPMAGDSDPMAGDSDPALNSNAYHVAADIIREFWCGGGGGVGGGDRPSCPGWSWTWRPGYTCGYGHTCIGVGVSTKRRPKKRRSISTGRELAPQARAAVSQT
jgi:hypothetical protein